MPSTVEFVSSLHSIQMVEAILYVRVDSQCYRIAKAAGQPLNITPMASVEDMREEAQTMTRFAPHFQRSETIAMAPLTQQQLEKMVASIQTMFGQMQRAG